ncbi:acetyl-CoA carboxylase biotin carboxyl carrier protein [Sporomusa malonica]|uniref:Biotin carboxyl carrier protein of acetyl-CoA carboxylase n=1 Tax=Sporomusa malonica TaxID=112901 RepID=A0A1W1ZVF7_9FIRM|nr:acetyl-CoA carboxylase biotin carboxyl carrier protein [Sporomusa malonica]SMC52455.1 biotin carboxyl carrier protein [Sporomusa malonica]
MLKVEEILEIIKAVNQSDINRFELEQEATRLVIVKGGSQIQLAQAEQTAVADSLCQGSAQTTVAAVEYKLHTLPAPMIGTFYAAPEPGAEPFVKVGQQVQTGTIVCVLEAMKLFNEIEAGIDGEIAEVLVKDGQFVEYGQPLFVIKPL